MYKRGEGSLLRGIPDGSVGKEYACNAGDAGDMGLIPRSGRPPEVGNGHPLQYSCLGNAMDREVRQATVHVGTESYMTEAT